MPNKTNTWSPCKFQLLTAIAALTLAIPWGAPAIAQISDTEASSTPAGQELRTQGEQRAPIQLLSAKPEVDYKLLAAEIMENYLRNAEQTPHRREAESPVPGPRQINETTSQDTLLFVVVVVVLAISLAAVSVRVGYLTALRAQPENEIQGMLNRSQIGDFIRCKSLAELEDDDCFLLAAKLLSCKAPPKRLEITFGSGRVASIIVNTDATGNESFMDELHKAIDLVSTIRSELWHLRKMIHDPTNNSSFDHKLRQTMKALDEANEDLRKRLIYIASEIHVFDQSRAAMRDPPIRADAA